MKILRKVFVFPRPGEFFGLLMLFSAVLLAMALVSYEPSDVSFLTRDSSHTASRNLAGRLGATVAEVLYQVFGLACWFLLVPLAAGGWRRVWRRQPLGPGAALFGYGGIFLGLLCLLTVVPGEIAMAGEPLLAGGAIGALAAGLLIENLNTAGAFVMSVAFMALGATIATHISFGNLLEAARKGALAILRRLRTAWARWRETRRKRKLRREIVRKHASREKSKTAPARPGAPDLSPAMVRSKGAARDAAGQARLPLSGPAAPPASASSKAPPAGRSSEQYVLPPLALLQSSHGAAAVDDQELYAKAKVLTEKCREFGVQGAVVEIHPGPVVTTFEFKPEAGIKYSKITGLVDDLCLALQAESVRIDRISGKSTVGVEVPNKLRETIFLRELLESDRFVKSPSKLSLAVGKRIDGEVYIADLARMPHLLIAGATGAGKSVCLNALIASMLYRATPDEVKFIFIDTKRLELGIYDEIPHLLTPVVTDPKKAANALRWACLEMERRYKMLADYGVRSIDQFNALIRGGRGRERNPAATPEELKPIPFIVVVIDELADLMIMSAAEVEEGITRLAQMARAVGIHLILSTQRPSVDVITGVIKANFPSRIAFRVSSKVDSRTILDSNGAEKLLGNGDMLFMPPGSSRLLRLHGSYMSEVESAALVEHLKNTARPVYDETVTRDLTKERAGYEAEGDDMFPDAVRCVLETGVASTSHLQRRLRLGYARAARLVDMMEARGIVGPPDGSKQREILVQRDFLERMNQQAGADS
ncbi:MAG TPA: DNA translocase FtsK [Candidatus Polarisedimenticolia bacterium]|nr:DNA translocase FtsK [Candidatus Polarisedimenticolia bacterium]